jgi:NAD-dependent deacetylase
MLPHEVAVAVTLAAGEDKNLVIISGAGISVESGLRPYRGVTGRWTEEGTSAMKMATAAYFYRHPQESWAWHLLRRSEVMRVDPNPAHTAIAAIEQDLGDRFSLITQNIDRLHTRAGNSRSRTIEIHGYLDGMRCSADCEGAIDVPPELDSWGIEDTLGDHEDGLLVCPTCGAGTRPHVLWFDEMYDEEHYGIVTAQRAVANAGVCITVGTSGGVPVAERLAGIAAKAGATLIDVNPNDNDLRRLALDTGGLAVAESASVAMPEIAAMIRDAIDARGSRSSAGSMWAIRQKRGSS